VQEAWSKAPDIFTSVLDRGGFTKFTTGIFRISGQMVQQQVQTWWSREEPRPLWEPNPSHPIHAQ